LATTVSINLIMPIPSTSDLPKPKSWDEFEDIVWEIYTRRWQDPYAQRYGRSGQAQKGVDIYGKQSNSDKYVVVQCKRYEDKSFNSNTIISEVAKLEEFTSPISEYLIATTTSRDTKIQDFVMKLNQERISENKFPVNVVFWDDLCSYLAEQSNYDLLRKYYSVWGEVFTKQQKWEEEIADDYPEIPEDEPPPISPSGMEDHTSDIIRMCEEAYSNDPIRLIEWYLGEKQQINALFRERRRGWYFDFSFSQNRKGKWSTVHKVCPIFLPLLEPDEELWHELTCSALPEDWYALDEIIRLGLKFQGSQIRWAGQYAIGENVADDAMEQFGVYVPDEDLLPVFLFINKRLGLLLVSYFKDPDGFAKENLLCDDNTDECCVIESLLEAQQTLEEKLQFYTEQCDRS
jgi:hypothetical protein